VTLLLVTALLLLAAFLYPRMRRVDFINEQVLLQRPLMIPPVLEPQVDGDKKVVRLAVQRGRTEILPGRFADTAGFNGNILGPTIRGHRGDNIRIDVTNGLSETTTVHWHGMHLPAAMDGGPHQVIAPGTTWSPSWTIANEAATLWYHPHVAGNTGPQIYAGLAGLFIIDDPNSDALALPKIYGVDDIPLIVQDRLFDAKGRFALADSRTRESFGQLGDTILVNGTYAPYVDVPQKIVRLRLVNASNARRYNFGFSDGRTFHQIATDGGLLDTPVQRTRLVLGPGERAEILVDMNADDHPLTLISDAVPGAARMFHLMRGARLGQGDEYQRFKILELRPRPSALPVATMPRTLNQLPPADARNVVRTRVFALNDRMSINDRPMDHGRVDQIVHKGDMEIWEIRNREAMFFHPFHIHGVQFRILDRDGRPPDESERGWKDTVVVNPLETVRALAQFSDYSDPHIPYMFHCHILEHEDMGMMGQFAVVDDLGQDVRIMSRN
jgi:bilirubin oxidase